MALIGRSVFAMGDIVAGVDLSTEIGDLVHFLVESGGVWDRAVFGIGR